MVRSITVVLFAILLAAVCADAEPVLLFSPPTLRGADDNLFARSVDLNQDGKADLVTTDAERAIQVHLGNGDGTFTTVLTPAPSIGIYLACGNVDGDAFPDLVSSSIGSELLLFLGNGDGSFRQAATLTGAIGPMTLGDFTGDGRTDVAAFGTSRPAPPVVFPGNGAGGFGAAITSAGIAPHGPLIAADVNHDDKLDLHIAGSSSTDTWLGTGNGTFVHAGSLEGAYALTVADLNGDGHLDYASMQQTNIVYVALGRGDGTFHPPLRSDAGMPGTSIAAADMNGDDIIDLLVTSGPIVSILIGKNTGLFEPPVLYMTATSAREGVVGDYDGDGDNDVAVHGFRTSFTIISGRGNGTLEAHRAFHVRPGSTNTFELAEGIALADVTGDGKLDAITVTMPWAGVDVTVLPGVGDGTFGAPIHSATGIGPLETDSHVFGDFTGDGKLDVVFLLDAGPQGVLFIGIGDGTFVRSASNFPMLERGFFATATAADFTNDGKLDLLVQNTRVVVYPGGGPSGFGAAIAGIQGSPFVTGVAADANGDGNLDVVYGHGLTLLGDGAGHFASLSYAADGGSVLGIADLDGDGIKDKLGFGSDGGSRLLISRGNGDGTFGAPASLRSPQVTAVEWLDVDGDGHLDFVFGTSVFFGDGAGGFDRFEESPNRAFTTPFAVGDVDGNGSPDIVGTSASGWIGVVLTNIREGREIPTTLTLEASNPSPRYGNPVKYTARVAADACWSLDGVVRFSVDGKPVALARVDVNGKATMDTAYAEGAHTVVATYLRNDVYASSSATLQHDVLKGLPKLFIRGIRNPEYKDRTMTIAVSLDGGSALLQPTGTLTIRNGNAVLATLTARQGDSALVRSFATPGTYTIAVDYSGDAHFEAASASYVQDIYPTPPTGDLVVTPAIAAVGEPVTLTVTFNPTSVTGTVEFRDRQLGSSVGTATISNGVASLTTTSLPAGTHSFDGFYSGDANFGPLIIKALGAISVRAGTGLYLVTPCRLYDSRDGDQPITALMRRSLTASGFCGIPTDAKAIVANVTAMHASASGWLSVHPDELWSGPGTNTIVYRRDKVRASSALIKLSGGKLAIYNGDKATVHVVIDVTGYFK